MNHQFPRWYIFTLTLLIVIAGAYFFFNVLVYIGVAVAFSFVGRPLMKVLTDAHIGKQHVPRWLGAIITILIMLAIATGLGYLFVPIVAEQARQFADIDTAELAYRLQGPLYELQLTMYDLGLLEDTNKPLNEYILDQIKDFFSFPFLTEMVNNVLSLTFNFLIGFFSVLFILFFFLKDRALFFNIITTLTPDQYEEKMGESIESIKELLTRYFIGIIVQLSIIFAIVGTGLWLVGLDNFLLIAMLAAIFNIIPYVGPMIGYVLALILGLSINLDKDVMTELLPLFLKITAVFGVAQLVDNFFSQPFIFSNSVKAHPLEIFLLIVAAGSVGGVLAMVLAIPAYTVLRVMGKEFFSDSKIVRNLTRNL